MTCLSSPFPHCPDCRRKEVHFCLLFNTVTAVFLSGSIFQLCCHLENSWIIVCDIITENHIAFQHVLQYDIMFRFFKLHHWRFRRLHLADNGRTRSRNYETPHSNLVLVWKNKHLFITTTKTHHQPQQHPCTLSAPAFQHHWNSILMEAPNYFDLHPSHYFQPESSDDR